MDVVFVFVRAGDVSDVDPETRPLTTLPPLEAGVEGEVVQLHGHFGCVPMDLLSWETKTSGLIAATFTDIRTKEGMPLRLLSPPNLVFCPLVVLRESGRVAL